MLEEQNSAGNLRLLKAMRYSYNTAKKCYSVRITVSLFIPFFSIVFYILQKYNFVKPEFGVIFPVIGSLWLAVAYYLEQVEAGYIEKGARIQEEFDTSLFRIPWNSILVGNKVYAEEIEEYSLKFKGNTDALKDWYSGLKSNHFYVNVILAQRSNLMWAISLKRNFAKVLLYTSRSYLILTIVFACIMNIPIQEYLLKILLPSMSILIYGFKTARDLTKQYQKLEKIGNDIEQTCTKFISENQLIDPVICRKYQDAVFLFNRSKAVLIPEWLYWLKRDEQDKRMLEVNERLSEKFNNAIEVEQ